MSHLSHQYLIDTHAHLNFLEFTGEIPEVLVRAKAAGVEKILCVGTDLETNNEVAKLALEYRMISNTVGFHPIHVGDCGEDDFKDILMKLEGQIKSGKPLAIGEIGLDYFRRDDREKQKIVFRSMLTLAFENDLPVIIHCRDAFDDLFEILEEYRGRVRGVLHCFTGGIEEARRAVEIGLLIGFTGLITYNNNEHILEAIRDLELEKILVETDCPYLSPVPHRGKRNEPAFVRSTAEMIVKIKNISLEEVSKATSANAEKLFKI